MMELFNITFLKNYGGPCFIWLLFLVSVIYLIMTEKKKHIRLIVIWASVVGLVLFICPLSFKVFSRFLDGPTYYRFLWTIPIGIIIAFAGTKAFLKHRVIGLILCAGLIVLTGTKVYRSQYMTISENEYQIPQQMIEICDAIHPEYFEAKACFPPEYIHMVLQYDASIQLAYGREVLVNGWSEPNQLYIEHCKEVLDVAVITDLCQNEQVEYYVARKDKQTTAPFKEYGWTLFYETNDYYVYKLESVKTTWEKTKEWLATLPEDEKNRWLDSMGIPRDYE